MKVYLASPNSQLQAHAVNGMDVLVSYITYSPWMEQYFPSYGTWMLDSGAYSELNSGTRVDVVAYSEWAQEQLRVDAWAGLDDISGDWKRSLKNYNHGGFPTIHDTDPPELLDDLIAMAQEGQGWIGIGLKPPREGKEGFVRGVLDQIPSNLHVHGWALRRYSHLPFDSLDSTNWWRDAMALKARNTLTAHLTYGECLDIIVKRYQRMHRTKKETLEILPLWN